MQRFRVLPAVALSGIALMAGCERTDPLAPHDRAAQTLSSSVHGSVMPVYGVGAVRRAFPFTGCEAAAHGEFDFWLGEWQVAPARSHIGKRLDGCVVTERYAGPAGFGGQSLNMYDVETGRWYQYWVGDFGGPLLLEGGLEGSSMRMSGHHSIGGAYRWTNRITWTPLEGGTVRQLWERSFDEGETYTATVFDGLYVPEPGAPQTPFRNPGVCRGGHYEVMNFLIGSWTVEAENGPELGVSDVSRSVSGCMLEERFTTAQGYESLSWMYSYFGWQGEAMWHRVTLDNLGERVALSGAPAGGQASFSGTEPGPGGREYDVTMTFEPVSADEVSVTTHIRRGADASDLAVRYRRR